MSQIKKLKPGGNVKSYGKLIIDGNEIQMDQDSQDSLNSYFKTADTRLLPELGAISDAINSGKDVSINTVSNTINGVDFNLSKRQERKLTTNTSDFSKRIDLLTDNKVQKVKEAIHFAGNFSYIPKKTVEEVPKIKLSKDAITLDFNTDESGNFYLSKSAEENFNALNRINRVLEHIKSKEDSKYDVGDWDLSAIRSWIEGQEDPSMYVSDLWTKMQTPGYNWGGEDEDFLRMFGINYTPTTPRSDSTPKPTDTTSTVTTPSTTSEEPTTDFNDQPQTTSVNIPIPNGFDPNKPTLITSSIAAANGLDDSYLNGVIYKGHPFKATDNLPIELSTIMQQVKDINNKKLLQSDRYTALSNLINIPSNEGFVDWTSGQSMIGFDINKYLRNLGLTSVALTDASKTLNLPEGYRAFKYYDNTTPGDNVWGFRNSNYLIYDSEGNQYDPATFESVNGSYITPELVTFGNPQEIEVPIWQNFGGIYGHGSSSTQKMNVTTLGTFKLRNGVDASIIVDDSGKYYVLPKGGYLSKPITEDLAKKLLSGYRLTSREAKSAGLSSLLYKQGGKLTKSKTDYIFNLQKSVKKGQNGLTLDDARKKFLEESGLLATKPTIPTETPVIEEVDETPSTTVGGIPALTISSKLNKLDSIIGLGSYLSTLRSQKKYRDISKKAIEAGRFQETAPVLNQYSTVNPQWQHLRNRLEQQQMNGLKAVTSDPTQYYAAKLTQQSNLNNNLADLTTQQSADQWQREQQNVGIQNQNILAATQTANQNRARNAAVNSALYNPDLEYLLRRDQSRQNLTQEVRSKLSEDVTRMTQYARNNYANDLQKAMKDELNAWNNGLYRQWEAEFNALTPEERAKYYGDVDEYIKVKYPAQYEEYSKVAAQALQKMRNQMAAWDATNSTHFNYPAWITGMTTAWKKGGRLTGNTRYTKEPDEQIWIDNNKATHRAIGKLNDNAIKLLLRALK